MRRLQDNTSGPFGCIKPTLNSVDISLNVGAPEVQAPFHVHRGRSQGQREDFVLYQTTAKPHTLCTESGVKGVIIWYYSEATAVLREQLSKLGRSIQYQEGLPEEYGNPQGEPSLIILDDVLNQIYGKKVCDLFTKGSHHRYMSVLLLNQNIFHQGPNCIYISLNAKYLVLLKNVRNKNQFLFLARQVYPEGSHSLYDSYRDATIKPHGYLVLDFAQNTDDRLRFRTNVFTDDGPLTVYAPVNDEAHKIDLS
jgi:hypothetical protein